MQVKKAIYTLALSLLVATVALGQKAIEGKVINRVTNKAIPYANLWIKYDNVGTTSSLSGFFKLRGGGLCDTSKIVVSSIGYRDTTVLIKDLGDEIELAPIDYQLEGITVYPKNKKELIINDLSEVKLNMGIMNDTTPKIVGRYFPFRAKYKDCSHIESVIIYTNDSRSRKLNLRIYSFDTLNVKPIKELIRENIIVKTKTSLWGKYKPVVVDLSKYALTLPKSGILVGVEWLIISKNKYKVTFQGKGGKGKPVETMYGPSLGATYNEVGYKYFYRKGYWWKPVLISKNQTNKKHSSYVNPAISLILTD